MNILDICSRLVTLPRDEKQRFARFSFSSSSSQTNPNKGKRIGIINIVYGGFALVDLNGSSEQSDRSIMFSTDSIRKKGVLQVQSERFFLKIFLSLMKVKKKRNTATSLSLVMFVSSFLYNEVMTMFFFWSNLSHREL